MKNIKRVSIGIIIVLVIVGLIIQEKKEKVEDMAMQFQQIVYLIPTNEAISLFLPILSFVAEGGVQERTSVIIEKGVLATTPIYQYSLAQLRLEMEIEDRNTFALLMAAESQDEDIRLEEELIEEVVIPLEDIGEVLVPSQDLLEDMGVEENIFSVQEQQYSYDWDLLQDFGMLQSTFYTVTPNTAFLPEMLDLAMLQQDLSIDKNAEEPQILIYHTHSQEDYVDSIPGDASTTVQGVGEELAQILRLEYGYDVLHHTGQYDVVTRDDAYALALPEIEKILVDNPSIEVVIDLHRDAALAGRDMVVDIDGRETARFMLFNGLSRTNKGPIDYLPNEYLQENLAFSFQLQVKAGEYYPGITRKIYVREYRYNMHINGKTILLELGDNSNTVEQAKNACIPIAHILDMVLSPAN